MVPALNEALNLAVVLPLLPQVHEVILVDGGSVDGTVQAARRALPDIVTVLQTRSGKGNALAAGFARVTGDIVVMFDADGSADPAEIERFVDALKAGADFAKGSRYTGRVAARRDITRSAASATGSSTALFNLGFRDRVHRPRATATTPSGPTCSRCSTCPTTPRPAPASGKMLWGDGFEIETVHQLPVRLGAGLDHRGPLGRAQPDVRRVAPARWSRDGLRMVRTLVTEWRRARGTRRLERRLDVTVAEPSEAGRGAHRASPRHAA